MEDVMEDGGRYGGRRTEDGGRRTEDVVLIPRNVWSMMRLRC